MDYSNLSLREKIFKTFIVTIREINTHGGPEEFFRKYPVGGMYYSEAKPLYDAQGLEVGTATTYEMLNRCKDSGWSRTVPLPRIKKTHGGQRNLLVPPET